MKKSTLIFSVILLFTTQAYSQLEYQTFEGKKTIKATLSNCMKMLDMTEKEWETEMNLIYTKTGIDEHGCVYFTTGSDETGQGHRNEVDKCVNTIQIHYTYYLGSNSHMLSDMCDEVKDYFVSGDNDGTSKYAFKTENFIYQITVVRKPKFEFIIFGKKAINNK